MDSYIELSRTFKTIRIPKGDAELGGRTARNWMRESRGPQLTWDQLLGAHRVVVLAEADSGKTWEFREQAKRLSSKGEAAFFLPIELLANEQIETFLKPEEAQRFRDWKAGEEPAYFFLDARDEANANRADFDTAIRRLENELRGRLHHSRLFFSSRPHPRDSVRDGVTIKEWLTPPESNAKPDDAASSDENVEDPFVSKIFQPKKAKPSREKINFDVTYVCLAPLDRRQKETYVRESGEMKVSEFFHDLVLYGIEFFTDRPGDLKLLLHHWRRYGEFDRKEKMCQKAIEEKLVEKDDGAQLSDQKALAGAMEVAAALTFAKSYAIGNADLEILNIRSVLAGWTPQERTSLLSRGIFVPYGYGSLKFHHRQTQEYLCAKWIDKLLNELGCQKRTIYDLIFKEVDGATVVVPSLKPVVAWLALWQPFILDKAIEVDPVIFLTLGDPSSLPIGVRRRILKGYASTRVSGDLANSQFRYESNHQFSAPELGSTIAEVWHSDSDNLLDTELLVMIADGKIVECANIAFDVARDRKNRASLRGLAVEALVESNAEKELQNLATQLVAEIPQLRIDEFAWIARVMFPKHVSVSDVCNAMENACQRNEDEANGLETALDEIVDRCPEQELGPLCDTVSKLFFTPPHVGYRSDFSVKYRYLSQIIPALTCRLVESENIKDDAPVLLRMLSASERCEILDNQLKTMISFFHGQPSLKVRLFWSDVSLARGCSENDQIKNMAQIMPENCLWFFSESDLPLLLSELDAQRSFEDRRLVLNTIYHTFHSSEKLSELGVEERISDCSILIEVWESYQRKIVPSDQEKERIERRRKRDIEKAEKTESDKQSWRDFKNELLASPESLLGTGKGQSNKLWSIKRWLEMSTSKWCNNIDDPKKLLSEVLNSEIANCYFKASGEHWRSVDSASRNNETELAFTSIFVDSKYTQDWVNGITPEECVHATKIALTNGHSFPDWLDKILQFRFSHVQSLVAKQLAIEWKSASPGQFFLYRFCDQRFPIPKEATQLIVSTICKTPPQAVDRLVNAIKVLRRTDLTESQRQKISAFALSNFGSSDLDFRINYLAILLIVDEDEGVRQLETWLRTLPDAKAVEIAVRFFGGYFEWHSGSILKDVLTVAKASTIEQLVHLSYAFVRVGDDIPFTSGTPNIRSNAQHSRSVLVNSLVSPADSERLKALKKLSSRSDYQPGHPWIKMMARLAAETMAESKPWTADVFQQFKNEHAFEIRNAEELFATVKNILDDIQFDFDNADSSSKRLLRTLGRPVEARKKTTGVPKKKSIRADEGSVQEWLAEQLRLRSRGLFTVTREPQVSGNKRPDLTVSISTCEIAIEVKQADSWSIKELKDAVSLQLAGQYLKVQKRKYGILFASNHRDKKWQPGKKGKRVPFQRVLSLMEAEARKVNVANAGSIEVYVFGLSAVAGSPSRDLSLNTKRKK